MNPDPKELKFIHPQSSSPNFWGWSGIDDGDNDDDT